MTHRVRARQLEFSSMMQCVKENSRAALDILRRTVDSRNMTKTVSLAALLSDSTLRSHALVSATEIVQFYSEAGSNPWVPEIATLVAFGRPVAGNWTYEDAIAAFDPFQTR